MGSRLPASIARVAIVLPLACAAPAAFATPLTIYFTGTVTGTPTGIFAGQGNQVTGSFTYDLAAVPTTNLPDFASFSSSNAANSGLDWFASVTVGGVTRDAADFAAEPTYVRTWLGLLEDNPFIDQFEFNGFAQVPLGTPPNNFIQYDWLFSIDLEDTGPDPPVGIAPGSDNLNGQLVDLSLLDLSHFEKRAGRLAITGPNPPPGFGGINEVGIVNFDFDAFSLTPIPEPGTGLLIGLGLATVGVHRRRSFRPPPMTCRS